MGEGRLLRPVLRGPSKLVHSYPADRSELGQIEALLSDTWPGRQLALVVEDLRAVYPRLEMAVLMVEQQQAKIPRQQNPATEFLLAVHDLFSELTSEAEPGIAGPLHRFTKRCAALIEPGIDVPKSENSFHKCLTATLARRTGKIEVHPKIIFPRKQGYESVSHSLASLAVGLLQPLDAPDV
jgi:hypothetical protein